MQLRSTNWQPIKAQVYLFTYLFTVHAFQRIEVTRKQLIRRPAEGATRRYVRFPAPVIVFSRKTMTLGNEFKIKHTLMVIYGVLGVLLHGC